MEQKIKIISINIILFIILFFMLDFIIFAKIYIIYEPCKIYKSTMLILQDYLYFYSRKADEGILHKLYVDGKYNFYRMTPNIDSRKEPILLFGCSFIYNSHPVFNESNRSTNIFAQYTGRPVYNRGRDGFGPPSILFQVEHENFYKQIKEPKYIIYTFIEDHVKRIYLPANVTLIDSYDILYKEKDSKLNRVKRSKFHKNFVLTTYIKHILWGKSIIPYNKTFKEKSNFFLKHMLQIKENTDKHWKNSKFIILAYETNSPTIRYLQPDLEKAGFTVIYRSEIAPFDEHSAEYCVSETDNHPNPKAWETIVPKLMEEIEKN